MIESYLTQNLIVRGETAIADYLVTNQSDYSNIWKESFADLINDLINRNVKVRRLCKRLYLESSSITKTATYNGVISDEDFAQRSRLVIPITAQTGTFIFTLQGTDDDGANYHDISLVSDDGTQGTTVTITSADTYSYSLTGLYKKYRLKITSAGTTITYYPYMIEDIYTRLHREKTRAKIYETLMSTNSLFTDKFEIYMNKYAMLLDEAKMIFDVGDDEEIEETEGEQEPLNIIFH